MSRVEKVKDGLVIRQNPVPKDVFLASKTIGLDQLEDDVTWGLIPLGLILPIMPHMVGAFQPSASGIVKDGLILCDGSAIPIGQTLSGTLPNINSSTYLRGATTSTGAISSSNSRIVNTPQLPVHSHPLDNVAVSNGPHNHPVSVGSVNAPHNHTVNIGTVNAPHSHPSAVTTATVNHGHSGSTGVTNGTHTHNAGTATANAPHDHDNSGSNSPNTYPNHSHGQRISFIDFGPTAYESNVPELPSGTGVKTNFNNKSQTLSTADIHGHTMNFATANSPHSHPIALGNSTASHSHTMSIGNVNAPHSHSASLTSRTTTHVHTGSVQNGNAAHNHVIPVATVNAPHTHNATVNNTGSTTSINFEPQYVQTVFVMRVL